MITLEIIDKKEYKTLATVTEVPTIERAKTIARYIINYLYPYNVDNVECKLTIKFGKEIFDDLDRKLIDNEDEQVE